MDSNQIYKILKANPFTKKGFLGVFSADELPTTSIERFPASLVVNTDKSGSSGLHWQGIFIPDRHTIEFFDSFGRKARGDIKDWIDGFPGAKVIYHRYNTSLQKHYETSCGPHVIYFLISRSRGKSFDSIVNTLKKCDGFTKGVQFADSFVKIYTKFLV